ncbi:MAG: hypothetical protein QOJ86_2386 [Bradyrhizobium sp.]|nr:hypothetical protein [Bradyrhizobium sp.]
MPVARYFMVVGSALLILLLIAGWSLPEPPPRFPDRPEVIERAAIRIRSERKWPEKILLDPNQLTIPPIEVALVEQLVAPLSNEIRDQTRVDALAKLDPDGRPSDDHRRPVRAKRKPARALTSTHVARARNRNGPPRWGTENQCCRFEWADRPEMSQAEPRRRVARRDSWIGWHSPEIN